MNGHEHPSDRSSNLFGLLKPYRGWVVVLIVFTLLGNVGNLLIPKIISYAIDAFKDDHYSADKIIWAFLLTSALILVFSYLQTLVQTYTSERVAFDLRKRLSDKISGQNYAFIRESNPSGLLTNLTSDVDSVKQFVSQAVSTIFSSVVILAGAMVMLLSINWRLGLPVIAVIPLAGALFALIFRKVRVYFKRSREVIDWLNKVINESILGAALIRVLNSSHLEYKKFVEASREARGIGISILTLFSTLIPLINFIANLALLVILVLGGHFVIEGSLTLGEFAAFNSYVAILIFPIVVMGFMSNLIAQAKASYDRISRVLQAPDFVDHATVRQPLSGKIEVRNVTLSFQGKKVLNNVSFTIEPGSKTAIIGPTAAGKTQLLNLLAGLTEPDSGEILFDGIPLNQYYKELFYRQIGLVFQDSVLFNMSLRENIAFSASVTDEALNLAIETAGLKDFIDTLPDGLETIVSERGTSLSGGQKQRIMLARALTVHPGILLLDDFTARVDRQTEKRITEQVLKNYSGLTLISVTQKIAPIRHFEQIILLMEGELVASGVHAHLKESCPEYVQIFDSQKSTSHYDL